MGWGPRGDSGSARGRLRATQPFYILSRFDRLIALLTVHHGSSKTYGSSRASDRCAPKSSQGKYVWNQQLRTNVKSLGARFWRVYQSAEAQWSLFAFFRGFYSGRGF